MLFKASQWFLERWLSCSLQDSKQPLYIFFSTINYISFTSIFKMYFCKMWYFNTGFIPCQPRVGIWGYTGLKLTSYSHLFNQQTKPSIAGFKLIFCSHVLGMRSFPQTSAHPSCWTWRLWASLSVWLQAAPPPPQWHFSHGISYSGAGCGQCRVAQGVWFHCMLLHTSFPHLLSESITLSLYCLRV